MLAFLKNLDKDIQQSLLNQLRDLWTHTSTALEGNTLTLGETKFVIEEGLTISGKPVKDHEEVIGYAKAIDLIYRMIGIPVTDQHIFDLHKTIQTKTMIDLHKPQGAWKVEPNGTYAINEKGKSVFLEYAQPEAVPVLMQEIMDCMNGIAPPEITFKNAPKIYAKIHMGIAHTHPFWDGNGRMARLLANINLLKAGLPPIVISRTDRKEYIDILAQYQLAIGEINQTSGVWPKPHFLTPFETFCEKSYSATTTLLEQAKEQQQKRTNRS